MNRISFFIFITTWALSSSATAASLEERRQTVEKLFQNGSLLRASCKEFADTILTRAGLPEIGKKAESPNDKNRSFDRSKENDVRPGISDSITSADKKSGTLKTSIVSKSNGTKQWDISITRRLKNKNEDISSETNFRFDSKDDQNCVLREFSFFVQPTKNTSESSTKKVLSVEECLDLALDGINKARGVGATQALKWLQDDCALNIRYAPETHKFLGPP